MNSPKVCYVEWIDINTDGNGPWVELPTENTPAKCFSIGWLVQESQDSIEISATYSDNSADERHALMTTTIPRCCITKLETCDVETLSALWAK